MVFPYVNKEKGCMFMDKIKIAENIFTAAEKYEQDEIELLRRLCSVDCGTGNIEGNEKIIEALSTYFSSIDVPYETIDATELGKHFVARIIPQKSKGKIILNAHIDTAFKPGDVIQNPFRIDDEGWIHGCGVSDCKGGVVISAFAVKICKELGLLPDYEIAIIYNCDEEIGSPSGQKLLKKESQNALCAYVFEPSRDEDGILTARMGHAKGKIETFGKQAHPAMYWMGLSATECLIKMLNKLYEKNTEMNNIYFNVANIVSGPIGIMSPYASADISFRINDDNPFENTYSVLMSLLDDIPVKGCTAKINAEVTFPNMSRSERNVAMYEHMKDIGKRYMKWDLPEQGTYGSGDACFLAEWGIHTVCGLGTYMSGAHTLKEKCRLESLKRRTELMALTLAFFDGSIFKA